ncbi:E3 ubiquitin-protein ligase TRIM71-like [Stylophora pistillata]|nr:E3 ubiquitin-protein ligase TRIM71-like [Stylophora pistillata]
MDIKTLLYNLREEVSCPVCGTIYTDPKQLPCLHSFCLQCLKNWHRTSHGRDTIRCPKCQVVSRIPDSGDLKDLPTSFYLNGLIDVLAIKECKTSQVGCGNCHKKSSESSYCFHCCMFWCKECLVAHNIIEANRDHRVLALKDFQEKDYGDVLKRPLYCSKQRHEKEELKYFCKNCETAACQSCVLIDHAGHAIAHLEEEAEKQKLEMKTMIETQRRDLQEKINTMNQLSEECATLIQQSEDVKREVQTFADNLIAAIEAKKQNILTAVDDETKRFLETLTTQTTELESEIKIIESLLEKADTILKRCTHAEAVQGKKSMEKIFQGADQNQLKDCFLKSFRTFVFRENLKIFDTINAEEIGTLQTVSRTKAIQSIVNGKGVEEAMATRESQFTLTTRNAKGRQCYDERDNVTVEIRDERERDYATDLRIINKKDGRYQISYSPRNVGGCKVTVKVNGEHVRGSQFIVPIKPFQFRPALSFGRRGSSLEKFRWPWGIAVNAGDEIAVTDQEKHVVQFFNSEGKFLRSFGKMGAKAEELNHPRGIALHNNGNIFVADSYNHRIQTFSGEGKYVGSFGTEGKPNTRLNNPLGLSVDSDGNIIVADAGAKLVKIFSPDGTFLMKIGEQGSFTFPIHCIQYGRYLIVSDKGDQCIKVFDRNGNFQYKFGKQGEGDGEFNSPRSLSVNKSGQLMVCDECNHRIQVFELNGKFVGKFGTQGGHLGEFNDPHALAILSTGQCAVIDKGNHRIQIFE